MSVSMRKQNRRYTYTKFYLSIAQVGLRIVSYSTPSTGKEREVKVELLEGDV